MREFAPEPHAGTPTTRRGSPVHMSDLGRRLVPSAELRDAPVRLASPEELAVDARDTPATARLEAFVD